ncbi:MAG: hypothetical protein QM784_34610 [Polyangiaceae bacterium]
MVRKSWRRWIVCLLLPSSCVVSALDTNLGERQEDTSAESGRAGDQAGNPSGGTGVGGGSHFGGASRLTGVDAPIGGATTSSGGEGGRSVDSTPAAQGGVGPSATTGGAAAGGSTATTGGAAAGGSTATTGGAAAGGSTATTVVVNEPPVGCEGVLVFAPAIDEALRASVGAMPNEALNWERLKNVTSLSVASRSLRSLAGVRCLTGLIELDVSRNLLTSLAEISSLPSLAVLDVSDNSISALTALATIGSLEELYIGHNFRTDGAALDLSVLVHLPRLRRLYAPNSAVASIAGLVNHPALERVELANDDLESVAGLGTLPKLRILDFDVQSSRLCRRTRKPSCTRRAIAQESAASWRGVAQRRVCARVAHVAQGPRRFFQLRSRLCARHADSNAHVPRRQQLRFCPRPRDSSD